MSHGKIRGWVALSVATLYAAILITTFIGNRVQLWCDQNNDSEYRQDSYTHAYGDHIQPESCASFAGFIDIFSGNADQRPFHDNEEAAQNSQAEQDLRAQRIMARWTYVIAIATAVSVVVMSIGTALVYLTLMESQKVTREAIRAAAASDKAADAAIKANRISRDALMVENRAWLVVEKIEPASPITWDGTNTAFAYRVFIKNIGKTIAREVAIYSTVAFISYKDRPIETLRNTISMFYANKEETFNVAPNAIIHRATGQTFGVQAEDVFNGDCFVFLIIGIISYRIEFEQERRITEFIYHVEPNDRASPFRVKATAPIDNVKITQSNDGHLTVN